MRRLLAALLLPALLTACGGGVAAPQVTPEDALGEPEPTSANGPSVPQLVVGEEYPGSPSTLGGTTHLASNGCWHLTMLDDVAMIAFPTGAELGNDGDTVNLAGGGSVPAGAVIEGTATLVPAEQLAGGADGYWGYITGFCDADRVVVFEELDVLVEDPAAIEVTEHHPCGFGFTAATADQHAALLVSPTTGTGLGGAPEGGSITLPDPGWNAMLRVGTDLMSNWCDDVLEPDEPTPVWYAEWPVTAGSLQFAPPDGPGCDGAPITADLVNLVVTTTDGTDLSFPELSITNAAWGCFAG